MGTRLGRSARIEHLESRRCLAVTSVGDTLLVNPPSADVQRLLAGADAVAFLSDNSILAAYSGDGGGDSQGVYFRRYDAQGATLGDPQLANVTTAGVQSGATVAALPEGGFIVAWSGRGAGDHEGVFARWFDEDGNATTGEVLINQTVGGAQSRPRVGVDTLGTAAFVWQGVGEGDFDGVFARRFDDDGEALTDELLVNTTTARQQAFADIAIAENGTALVTWSSRKQDGSDWGVFAQRLDANGDKTLTEFRVNTTTTGSQTMATVEALATGFVVGWQSRGQDGDGWGVFGRHVDAGGEVLANEFRINADAAGHQRQVSIAVFNDTSIVAAWTELKLDGTGTNVLAREMLIANGTATGQTPFVVNSGTATTAFGHQSSPSVAAKGARAAIAWWGDGATDHDGTYLRRFSLATNQAPNMTTIESRQGEVGVQLEVTVTATDGNEFDLLTYTLVNAPDGATIQRINNGEAIIRWTPQDTDLPGPITFRVRVTDDGLPPMSDTEEFQVTFED
jgi:hypothetical protein